MTVGVVIPPDGPPRRIEVTGLDEFQAAVGGYIEGVDLTVNGQSVTAYCNEEGKLREIWHINPLATALYNHPDDLIVGPLLVVGDADEEGNDLDLSPDLIAYLLALRP